MNALLQGYSGGDQNCFIGHLHRRHAGLGRFRSTKSCCCGYRRNPDGIPLQVRGWNTGRGIASFYAW